MRNLLFDIKIFKITSLFKIREISFSQYKTLKYIITSYYFSRIDKYEKKVLIYIRLEIHVINELRTKILINNDFIESKEININIIN